LDEIDKSFMLILFFSFVLHFGSAGYFILFPLPSQPSLQVVRKVQEQFTNILLDRETEAIASANALSPGRQIVPQTAIDRAIQRHKVRLKPGQAKESPIDGLSVAITGGGTGGNGERQGSGGISRQEKQRFIEQQVSSQGILGIITSGRNSGDMSGVNEILTSTSQKADKYVQVYDGISKISSGNGLIGVAMGGTESAGSDDKNNSVRGGRATESGQIDAYISDLSTTQTPQSYLLKSTKFVVSTPAPIMAEESGVDERPVGMVGARDIDKVAAVVMAHSPAIQYCYERELKRNPDFKGKIAVRFTINPAGAVIDVEIISTTLENDNVERCILARIGRWDDFGPIEPSLGNTTFRQVYTFGF
jgi:hypothetical protein